MLIDHELRTDIGRTFLARLGEENHVAIERGVRALEHEHQHQAGDEVVLVINRATAVHVAAGQIGAERPVIDPLLRIDGDDVGVAQDEDGLLLAVPLDACDEIGAVRVGGEHLNRYALFLEDLFDVGDRAGFVAGWITRVELDERAEVLKRFRFDRFPVDGRLCTSVRGHASEQ